MSSREILRKGIGDKEKRKGKKKQKTDQKAASIDEASLKSAVKQLRKELVQDEELRKTINTQKVKKLVKHIYEKFNLCEVEFNDQSDQNAIRSYLNEILIPCFSLIIELDCVWYFVLISYIIISNKIQFFSEEEKNDIIFRFANCRVRLKLNISLPLKADTKEKILAKEEEKSKFGCSDACYILKKLSLSRRDGDVDYVQRKTKGYFYFLENIYVKHTSKLRDSDLTWLIKDLWPPRIESVLCDDKEVVAGIEDALGSRILPFKVTQFLFKELNFEQLILKWTDGTKEEIHHKLLSNWSSGSGSKKDYMYILIHMIFDEYKQGNITLLFDELIDIIVSHVMEKGEIYVFANLDFAYFLELCYTKDSAMAIFIYQKMIANFHKASEAFPVSCRSLQIMKTWKMEEILSAAFVDNLNMKSLDGSVDNIITIMTYLSNRHDIDVSCNAFWNCFQHQLSLSVTSSWMAWLTFLMKELTNITKKSLESGNESLLVTIEVISNRLPKENCLPEGFIKWFLQNATLSDVVLQKTCLGFITEVIDHLKKIPEKCDIEVPFELIHKMLSSAQSTDHLEGIHLFSQLFMLHLNEGLSTGFYKLDKSQDTIIKIFFICFKNGSTDKSDVTINSEITSVFKVFLNFLSNLKVPVAVSILKNYKSVQDLLIKCFCTIPVSRALLRSAMHAIMSPDLECLSFGILKEVFRQLFDSTEHGNELCIADIFNMFCETLIKGNLNKFLPVFTDFTFDIISGFTHKNLFIRESCVKAISFIMNLEKDVTVRLLTMVNKKHVKIANVEDIIKERNLEGVDVLNLFFKSSLECKERNLKKLTSKECMSEVNKLTSQLESNAKTQKIKSKTFDVKLNTEGNVLKKYCLYPEALVETETLCKNLSIIKNAIKNPINLLLQGETGAGKTAVIMEAARRAQAPLIRFNMSSSTTIANICGAAVPSEVNGKVTLHFKEGPFTTAFRKGAWLLLDEFNLAPGNVLSCIQNALDTEVLFLPTESIEVAEDGVASTDGEKRYLQYKKHPDFQLFCTQNPSTGLYKGKREQHSSSMLSRFTPVVIKSPSEKEKEFIIRSHLEKNNISGSVAPTVSRKILSIHQEIDQLFKDKLFTERNCAYLELTLRDAIRFAERALPLLIKANKIEDVDMKALGNIAFCIYCSRLRNKENREKVEKILTKSLLLIEDAQVRLTITYNNKEGIGTLCLANYSIDFGIPTSQNDEPHDVFCNSLYQSIMINVLTLNNSIVPPVGYDAFRSLLNTMKNCSISLKDRLTICFKQSLSLTNCKETQETVKNIFIKTAKDVYKKDKANNYGIGAIPKPMIGLTKNMKRCWFQILGALDNRQPILISGQNGCGKSMLIESLGKVLHKKMLHLYITPETEPDILVGNFVPEGKGVVWQEGLVTKAVRDGYWIVLENLSEAQSTVLERLNSVLENPPVWTVTENIEKGAEIFKVNPDFRILATMTPPSGNRSSECLSGANVTTNNELSPALYNRFAVINLTEQQVSRESLSTMYDALAGGEGPLMNYKKDIVSLFLELYDLEKSPLNLHHFTKTVIGACKLFHHNVLKMNVSGALYYSIDLNMVGPFKRSTLKKGEVITLIKRFFPGYQADTQLFATIYDDAENNSGYVLDKDGAKSLYENACLISASVLCDSPVLLEGPAASGKTSLVKFISQCHGKLLERVNNTENTSVADYLGSIMPDGRFAPGPLVRAIQTGSYFLADEFDLAEPAVLNMLYPILEGKKKFTLPNTGQVVSVAESFRFFATQNGVGYSGRKELPKSLMSRFTLITFNDFTEDEVRFIIEKRSLALLNSEMQCEIKDNSVFLAKAYSVINESIKKSSKPLFGAGVKLTIRELLKWIKRKCIYRYDWGLIGFDLLYTRVREEDIQLLASLLLEAFPKCNALKKPDLCKPNVMVDRKRMQLINRNNTDQRLPNFKIPDKDSDMFWNMLTNSSPLFLEKLWNVCIAISCNEPVLLIGPTSYKSHLINTWCKMYQKEANQVIVLCNQATDSADFVGRLRPYSKLECLNLLCIIGHQYSLVSKNLIEENIDVLCGEAKILTDFLLTNIQPVIKKLELAVSEFTLNMENGNLDTSTSASLSSIHTDSDVSESLSASGETDYGDSSMFFRQDSSASSVSDEISEKLSVYSNKSSDKSSSEMDDIFERSSCIEIKTQLYEPVDDDKDDDGIDVGYSEKGKIDLEVKQTSVSDCESIGDDFDNAHGYISVSSSDSELSYSNETNSKHSYSMFSQTAEQLRQKMEQFLKILHAKLDTDNSHTNMLSIVIEKYKSVFYQITSHDSEETVFIFQDGPCTKAIKEKSVLILENVHLPSQAVTERLNSLLEIERSFVLHEDLTLNNMAFSKCSLQASLEMPIFATVHTLKKVEQTKIKLSPAIRSRMTEIAVQPYIISDLLSLSGLQAMGNDQFAKALEESISLLKKQINITSRDVAKLRDFVYCQKQTQPKSDDSNNLKLIVMGIAFLWIDQVSMNKQEALFDAIMERFSVNSCEELVTIFKGEPVIDTRWAEMCDREGKKYAGLSRTPFYCSLAPETDIIKPLDELYLSKTTFKNICRIFAAAECGMNLLLNGPPGVGKTKIIQEMAHALGYECVRINFSANTTYEDLIGSFIPKIVNGKRTFEFVVGSLLRVVMNSSKTWILLDEINLAHPVVLEKLIPIFASNSVLHIEATGEKVAINNVHIFATKNPEAVGGGRNKLHESVLAHFTVINLQEFSDQEISEIGLSKFLPLNRDGPVNNGSIPKEQIPEILKFHIDSTKITKKSSGCRVKFNLRDLVKFIRLAETNSEFHKLSIRNAEGPAEAIDIEGIRIQLELIYAKGLSREEDRDAIHALIDKYFPTQLVHTEENITTIEQGLQGFVRVGYIYLKKGNAKADIVLPYYYTKTTLDNLVSIAAATRTGHTLLLRGGNSSGKTSLILEFSRLTQRKLILFPITKDTTTSDLIGTWTIGNDTFLAQKVEALMAKIINNLLEIGIAFGNLLIFSAISNFHIKHRVYFSKMSDYSRFEDVILVANDLCNAVHSLEFSSSELKDQNVKKVLSHCAELEDIQTTELQKSNVNFIFVEGPLLEAVRNGYWFLLDNLGQAPGDVMERLNSLAESDPQLVIFEGGKHEVLTRLNGGIHKDFRLFATHNTDNSRKNNISDAFINRCIVINLTVIDLYPQLNEMAVTDDAHEFDMKVENMDAYQILCKQLEMKIQNPDHVAEVLVKLHLEIIQLCQSNQIKVMSGYKYSFRNILLAGNIVLNCLEDDNFTVAEAVTYAILRCYCDPLINPKDSYIILRKYVSFLQKKATTISSDIRADTDNISKALGLVDLFGDIVSDIILYAFLCLTKVFQCNHGIKEVEHSLKQYLEELQHLFQAYNSEIKERHDIELKFDYDEWIDCDSHAKAASNWLEKLKIVNIVKRDSFENIEYMTESIRFKASDLATKLNNFVVSTSLVGARDKLNQLQSIILHCTSIKIILSSVISILQAELQGQTLISNVSKVLNAVCKFNIAETYRSFLNQFSASGYEQILQSVTNAIEESKVSNEKTDHANQQLSVIANNLEKAFHLPVISGKNVRKRAIDDMIAAFPELALKEQNLYHFAKIEFLSAKLDCICRTPELLLQKPKAVSHISLALLCKLNCLYLLDDIIQQLSKNLRTIAEQKQSILNLQKRALKHTTEDIHSLDQLIEVTHSELQISETHTLGKKVTKILKPAYEDAFSVREHKNYQDLTRMIQSINEYKRTEVIHKWTCMYNEEKSIMFFNGSFGFAFKKEDTNNVLDVVSFFMVILYDFQKMGIKFHLVVLEDIETETDKCMTALLNVQHRYLFILSQSGASIIVDRESMQSVNSCIVKIFVCCIPSQKVLLKQVVLKLQRGCHKVGMRYKTFDVVINNLFLHADLYTASLVLQQFFSSKEIFEREVVSFPESSLDDLKKKSLAVLQSAEHLYDVFNDVDVTQLFVKIEDIIDKLDLNEKNGYTFAEYVEDVFQNGLRIITEHHTNVKRELRLLQEKFQPESLNEKAQLYVLLKSNSDQLSWMKAVKELIEALFDQEVNQYIVVHSFIETFQTNLNKLFVYSLSVRSENTYDFCTKATNILSDGFLQIISNISVFDKQLIITTQKLVSDVKEMIGKLEDLFKYHSNLEVSGDISFDIDALETLSAYESRWRHDYSNANTFEASNTVDSSCSKKWSWKLDIFVNVLKGLCKTAMNNDLHDLLQELVETIAEVKDLYCNCSTERYDRMQETVSILKQKALTSLKEIEEEKKETNLFFLTGIETIIPPLDITKSDMVFTKDEKPSLLSEHTVKLDEILETLTNKDDVSKSLSAADFDTIIRSYIGSTNVKLAVEIVYGILQTILTYELDKTKVMENLVEIENLLDIPDALLLVFRLKSLLKQDGFMKDELTMELTSLSSLLRQERLHMLEKLDKGSIHDLVDFVCIPNGKVSLRQFCGRLTELLKVRYSLTRQLQQTSHSMIIKPQYITMMDFLPTATDSTDISLALNPVDPKLNVNQDMILQELKKLFKTNSTPLFCDHFVKQLSDNLYETVAASVKLSKEVNDHTSIAYLMYCNVNFLNILTQFWADIESNLCFHESVLGEQQTVILGGQVSEILSEKKKILDLDQSLKDELANLEEDFKEKEHCHLQAMQLNTTDSYSTDDVFSRQSILKNENENWEKEFERYSSKKERIRDKLKENHDILRNAEERRKEIVRNSCEMSAKVAQELGRKLAVSFDSVLLKIETTFKSFESGSLIIRSKEDEKNQKNQVDYMFKTKHFYTLIKMLEGESEENKPLSKLREELLTLVRDMNDLFSDSMKNLSLHTGTSSKLFLVLEKYMCLSNSVFSSLQRLLQELQFNIFLTQKEKYVRRQFNSVKARLSPIVAKVLNDKKMLWKQEYISVLTQSYEELDTLSKEAINGNRFDQINISYLLTFFSRFLLYCLQITDEFKCDDSVTTKIIKTSGLTEKPKGHAACRNLFNSLTVEYRSLTLSTDSISVHAIGEEIVKTCNAIFSDETKKAKGVGERVRLGKTDVIKTLINIFNHANILQQYMEKLLNHYRGDVVTEEEFASLQSCVSALDALSSISCNNYHLPMVDIGF
ncbi:uncharacterized protein LOC130614024 [Hydractinia symbiolongicarpus]|uniref:uncharacterized protein LOC130614024 n=1 Tax=Hydractinia symbiolongicarpus TaxID=13093 RepID=UPI00254E8143|nr:uncharacterized protein LOC130614024 [Hydractinia symbiolongicarpus]XP_057291393.1 uncharacterized protein LOC130614024 [Hydractinia symbiolongicarpus]XP_057291394.1 uncharacterized protein LOC130614024 [Hydractinia symbiolongicarpus]XP_057291395.1 uncharacterized protein LOC130614024 [Hydractinia symbiolongicarpus]